MSVRPDALPAAVQRSGTEPGIQRMNREAPYSFVPLTRLVMCWVPDQVPLSLHLYGNRGTTTAPAAP